MLKDISYDKDLPIIIKNLSIEFLYGKKYLIRGRSGEGKSTIIKLVLGILEPDCGRITLGGKPVSGIRQTDLFQTITAVMQESEFFNLSIYDNLTMFSPDVTDAEIDWACKMAEIFEFIQALPDKYNTIIGERGVKLSGGQAQRLAIARLIIHHPQIAILDEATSSLDSLTEAKILDNLNRIFKSKTLIVISHKPALQIDFDSIVTIDHNMS